MTLIEGFGDEVPIFIVLAVIVVAVFIVLAWKSTDVPELAQIPEGHQPSFTSYLNRDDQISHPDPPDLTAPIELDDLIPLSLDLISGHQTNSSGSENATPPTEAVTPIIEANPLEEQGGSRVEETNLRRRIPESADSAPSDRVCVRLKYMDDTQRVVESSSSTPLGEFKKEHFKNDLSAGKVVKLIFNGQVLSADASPLSQLGLENNCVVHCLVHQPRPATTSANSSSTQSEPSNPPRMHTDDNASAGGATHLPRQQPGHQQQQNAAEAGIDIGGLLVPLLGVILGLVWYCRIAYAAHFTAAATTALVGLSGICIFSILLVWYPMAQDA